MHFANVFVQRELAHGVVLDEDPYDMCHRMATSHLKAGTSPLGQLFLIDLFCLFDLLYSDEIRANFPPLDNSGFEAEENAFEGFAFDHGEDLSGGLLFP